MLMLIHELTSTLIEMTKWPMSPCVIIPDHVASKMNSEESSTTLNSRIAAMNQFIHLNQELNRVDRAKISPFIEWRRRGGSG
jgi:hypothetical protein